MFEDLERYLRSRDLTYTKKGDSYVIVWNGCNACQYYEKGWTIETLPEMAEDENLKGEEWIKLRFQFIGIDDDALFGQEWIAIRQEYTGLIYDGIYVIDRFQDKSLEGTPEMEIMLCLDYTEFGMEAELDWYFFIMSDLIANIMARYEQDYIGAEPDREGGRFTQKALYDFVRSHLPLYSTHLSTNNPCLKSLLGKITYKS